jgi:hypothetical protein
MEVPMKFKFVCRAALLCAFCLLASFGWAQLPTPTPTPPVGPPLPSRPYARVTYFPADPAAQAISVISPGADGIFALVGLQPDQVVQVIVQYPTSEALQLLNLEAVDGGIILPSTSIPINGPVVIPGIGQILQYVPPLLRQLVPDIILGAGNRVSTLIISAGGTLSFIFVASHEPGKNQVSLRRGSQEMGLQFWVLDPQNPQANPPAITASNPYPAAAD